MVRSRLGQTGSQKPHSTQVVADSSIGGVVFRSRRCAVGSRLRTTPGDEHPVGIGEPLHPPHQLGRLRAPLALHVRRHVHAGPVLGLQRAVVLVDDQRDQALHEGLVALDVLGLGEVRGQHEVEVPGRGVAGDAGQEAVLDQQRLEVAGALGDPGGRDADVLEDQRRARQAQAADQSLEALAHPPRGLDLVGVAGEGGRADRLVAREQLGPTRDLRGELLLGRAAVLDQERRRGRVELFPLLRRADHVPGGGDQRGRDHQLDRGGAAGDQVVDRGDRGVDVGEVDPGGGGDGGLRDRLEDDLGDVGERPLRADQQATEDLQRLIGIEEGAEAIAGGVLDLELAPDACREVGVGADLVADRREARGELRLGRLELGGGARRGGVDPRPRGQDEGQRAQGRVAVLGHPAAHPARVVGDDAADGGDVGARRVGAEAAAVRREHAVDVAEDRAGADPDRGAVLEHGEAAEVAAHVDQDAVGLALAVEAGAAGAEGDRDALRAAEGEDRGDVARPSSPSPPRAGTCGRATRRRRT